MEDKEIKTELTPEQLQEQVKELEQLDKQDPKLTQVTTLA